MNYKRPSTNFQDDSFFWLSDKSSYSFFLIRPWFSVCLLAWDRLYRANMWAAANILPCGFVRDVLDLNEKNTFTPERELIIPSFIFFLPLSCLLIPLPCAPNFSSELVSPHHQPLATLPWHLESQHPSKAAASNHPEKVNLKFSALPVAKGKRETSPAGSHTRYWFQALPSCRFPTPIPKTA